jgi:predicted ATPase/DNA-binding CsgD family transcriptional regulator
VRSPLPLPLTSFVGRDHELEQLEQLLFGGRLLTLTGAGGSGKTRLAIRLAAGVAERFENGVEFVPLASLSDPAIVLPTIAQALGLPQIGGREPFETLREYLQGRHLLLVLDNFEHLLSAGPRLVDLLAYCPRLWLLVTSRFALRLSGEQEYAVPPLAVPDAAWAKADEPERVAVLQRSAAVRLFVDRARGVQPDFAVSMVEAVALADICRRLDGLPLAIELAAARVRLLPLTSLAAHLAGPAWQRKTSTLHLLAGGARDLPERQQTLRATIAWSYALLTASEQSLVRRVSVFCAGATLSTIQGCAAAPDDVLRDVEGLIAKSLLLRRTDPDGEPRYFVLETISEFGLERLAEAGELEDLRRWHAEHYLALAEQAEPLLRGPDERAWLDRLEAEHDNIRAALEWALATPGAGRTALRLAGALAWFWLTRGYTSEGRRWLDRTLAADQEPTSARLKALNGAAWLAHAQRDSSTARQQLAAAVALAHQIGDKWALAWTQHLLGRVAYFDGDAPTAQSLAEQSLALAREVGDEWLIAWSFHLLGLAAHIAGRYDEALARYERALRSRRRLGHAEGIGICLQLMGMIAYRRGEMALARGLGCDGLVALRDVGARWVVHNGLVVIAAVAGALGDHEQAVSLLAAGDAFSELVDMAPIPLAETLVHEALVVARSALPEASYAAAWAAGRALSLDEAIAQALLVSSAPMPEQSPLTNRGTTLSPREREVLRLIAAGDTSKEIARALGTSVTTVERHITHLYEKIGVRGRAEATAYALRHGLA